ncbi:MAG: hypothetical protein P4L84_15340, partial [Isosphaeraceae bacterium]|nr:hypothetical protein [Isosphaeraceae bacterium]
MSTAHAYPKLIDAIDDLRRRWRVQKVVEGGLLTLAGVLGTLTLTVAADNVLQPHTAGRWALAIVLWGTFLVMTLRWVVQRWLEDRRDDFFAALVERRHPELGDRLINALQLGRVPQPGTSPQFIQAIIDDAAGATAELDLPDSLDLRPTRRAGGIAAVSFTVIALYAAVLTPRFVNGMVRVLLPVADIPPFTATRVVDASIKPGDTRVPEGATVAVRAQVEGAIPASAQLLRRTGNGPWQALPMLPDPKHPDLFGSVVAQPGESFDYQVVAGDGRSRTFHVEVVKRPRVEALALTYTPPAYTGLQPQNVASSDGEVAGLPGTAVRFELKATKPLKQAVLVTEQGVAVALMRSNNGSWAGRFSIASAAHSHAADAQHGATPPGGGGRGGVGGGG